MIFSGSLVQTNGRGFSLASARKRLMAACVSMMERNTPNLSRRLVSLAKNPSTALSQEADVGGEVEGPARVALQPGAHLGMFVRGVVVHDGVDLPAGRHAGIDGVEEADELLMAVLLHAASEDGAVEDVQRGKQGCGA